MTLTVVLDCDDTLYPERDYVRSGTAAVGEWVRATLGVDGFAVTAMVLHDQGVRGTLFDAALEAHGVDRDPALIARLVTVYREHRPRIRLADDARRLLSAGRYRFAVISDGPAAVQRRKFDALGLAGYAIDPLLCTDDWGPAYRKPHARAFEAVEMAHRGISDGFVYVGDNPAKDFLAPRALGWLTVQIDRPGAVHARTAPSPAHEADGRIETLDALDGVLARMNAAALAP